jgi:5-hydroxyisourate hydrolase-like protein (transthyretin family)
LFDRRRDAMKIKVVILTFLLMIPFAACTSPASDEEKTMILEVKGTVTNAKTGLPIASALIEVGEFALNKSFFDPVQNTRTDKEGRYYISIGVDKGGYMDGAYNLRASADGYKNIQWPNQYYSIKRSTEVQTADFQLVPL